MLAKLGRDWWTDENYSHGLLVPFVIAIIIWREWDRLKSVASRGNVLLGGAIAAIALLMLLAGVVGAELFTQRISMVLMLAGVAVYFLGRRILNFLAVPFVLLLLAIPVPQIVFNRIALPLQTSRRRSRFGAFASSTCRRFGKGTSSTSFLAAAFRAFR